MKKLLLMVILSVVPLGMFAACGEQPANEAGISAPSASESVPTESTEPDVIAETQPTAAPEAAEQKLKMTVDGQEIIVVLYDTPTAAALWERLPMELSFSDYNGTEKIAYPPNALPTEGEPDGCDPDAGDLCLYAPWGNLCIFYQDFRFSQSLIKLGHVESGMDILTSAGDNSDVVLERGE